MPSGPFWRRSGTGPHPPRMTLIPSLTAGGLALAALVLCSAAQAASLPGEPSGIAPARPGEIAVREEFEAARRAGTREAYDLFIARHPDHALAERARRERDQLPDRK
jgi:hypothetical protein